MSSLTTLIKWPGGKAKEIKYIEHMIPPFERYIEPFFGGGAMFFYLKPQKAVINDISDYLCDFYKLAKEQNKDLYYYLCAYNAVFNSLLLSCKSQLSSTTEIYKELKSGKISKENAKTAINMLTVQMVNDLPPDTALKIISDKSKLQQQLCDNEMDKMTRTIKSELKKPFSNKDLEKNLITGFISGLYMYFRDVYNDILLKRTDGVSLEYKIANFYFIREYCYGSMFRYNSNGEFNIPYGGMSYNKKNFSSKIENIFSRRTQETLSGADIYCMDFEKLFSEIDLTEKDFMFLDPPYDTDFSDYEGNDFTKNDQKRLADALKKTKAKFLLIIKNTDYIYSLYKDSFNIMCFDKTYTYNVRSRNERKTEHLIITNIPTKR